MSDRLYVGASDSSVWRTALSFDLAGVPADAVVTDAELGLYYDGWCIAAATSCYQDSTPRRVDAHVMTQPWSTSSTSSQLGFDPSPAASFTLNGPQWPQWMGWDVTDTVNGWVSGAAPNHGFLVKKLDETPGSGGPAPPGRRFAEPSVMPRLEVTYASDAVELGAPQTLHSDGADLEWTRYTGPSGAPFDRYEVHRVSGSTPGFTPSPATLLTTIGAVEQTSYRDTTAAPNRAFTYKVVANSSVSNPQSVTLPGDGLASKLLQPDPVAGKATELSSWTGMTNCATYGAGVGLSVGTYASGSQDSLWRSLVSFDLSDVPTGARVDAAELSLYQAFGGGTVGTVDVHRVTRAWREGSGGVGPAQCTGDGATWYVSDGTTSWSAQGGDYASSPAASRTPGSGGWDRFDVTTMAQTWADGAAPNFGMLLKARTETLNGTTSRVGYHSDDLTISPSLRPQLAVAYADGSHAQGPTVALTTPAAGATVSGQVEVTASASDDRRVESVEFRVDGQTVATDTTAPYAWTWDTTTVTNGARNLTVMATDDAGNTTTSAAVAVTVRNTAPPTVTLTAPNANATVAGTVTVSASAGDDVGVDRVEFFADGSRIGSPDTTAPYSVAWDTLNPAMPAFDGTHELTARAWDGDGQVTAAAPRSVTVANTAGTVYAGSLSSSTAPPTMAYDPAAGTGAQTKYGLQVTATNNSTGTWDTSVVVARYRWIDGDGVVAATSGDFVFPAAIRRGKSGTTTVLVTPPLLGSGTDRAQYTLRVDLFHKTTGRWFSAAGMAPLDNPVIVNKAIEATALGLEEYYHYEAEPAGAGMDSLVNVASGNNLLSWSPWSSPGRGLGTVLGLTYNSLEDRSDSPVGNNFSLSISSLTRFGLPLEVHPNKADEIAGNTKAYIEFTDGDGTTHRFTRNANGGWDEPAGVHLYLREYSATDPARKWALSRPDEVTFFYDQTGFPSFVADRHGNELRFTTQAIPPGEDPGQVKRRITTVTDPAGVGSNPAPSRAFTVDYLSKAEASKARQRGKIKTITDHTGSALVFDYYEDGNLRTLTQKGGTHQDATGGGFSTPDRSWVFTYTTSDGTGPAIPAAPDRVNPNPNTPNQSTRLYSVTDPRGKETRYSYYGPGSAQLRWKLASRTNRDGSSTSYTYNLDTRVTTATAPLGRATTYGYDTTGQVTTITNPLNQTTTLAWTGDRQLHKITEPTGVFTEYAYNANGYLTDVWDQLRNHTKLTYDNIAADTGDVASRWKPGRAIAHLSRLATKTSPRGTATTTIPDDYQWDFGYTTGGPGKLGNLLTETQPAGTQPAGQPRYTTSYTYNPDGTVATVTDPGGDTTRYQSYDANGLPTQVTDAAGSTARFGYDGDGALVWSQDPAHAGYDPATDPNPRTYRTYTDYDEFGRLRRTSTPKSTSRDAPLIWTAVDYDVNDNPVTVHAAAYGHQYVAGPKSTATYDPMDRLLASANPDAEITQHTYDAAGRVAATTLPKGVASTADSQDHAVFYTYDTLDRLATQTRYDTAPDPDTRLRTHYCYDTAGDLVSVTAPRAAVATVNCASPPGYTTTHTYDPAHKPTATINPLGETTSRSYDADGNTTTVTDAENHTSTATHDPRGLVTRTTTPLTTGRTLTTLMTYDGAGNLVRHVSPRGWDASTDKQTFAEFTTGYSYDPVGQLVRITLPTRAGETPTYVHRSHDTNGNLTTITLPDPAPTLAGVPQDRRTDLTYYDTGQIATTADHVNPATDYDYNARGQQTYRKSGTADPEIWTYHPDGPLAEHKDRRKDGNGGQSLTYTYDANNQLTVATDSSGIIDATTTKPVRIEVSYDSLGRPVKTRHRAEDADTPGNYTVTSLGYDANSNTIQRIDDATETPAGTQVTAGTKHTYTYDTADRLLTQNDYLPGACQKIDTTHTALGLPETQVIRKAPQACDAAPTYTIKQSTARAYYDNQLLKTLTIRAGALDTGTLKETHALAYTDPAGTYLNGNRGQDTFTQKGPNTACNTTSCTATYTYDGRDRLTQETRTGGPTIGYQLDAAGNLVRKTTPNQTTFYDYTGMQLTRTAVGTATNYVTRHHYDPDGNLDCVTTPAHTAGCPGAGAAMLADYHYDYLNRLEHYTAYTGGTPAAGGTITDETSYTYDPLNRITTQTEKHGSNPQRVTQLTYLGLSTLVATETQAGNPAQDATKTYSYDANGQRISLTEDPHNTDPTQTYTYGYDPHGSVSVLLDDTGQTKATYGYDAYGNPDTQLTAADPTDTNLLNPYRYTAKRHDTGTGTLNMGARHYTPTTSRFLQPDQYAGALANLGLSTDPINNNRYSLAAGNPLNYIETDGHMLVADNVGGAGGTPAPRGTYSDPRVDNEPDAAARTVLGGARAGAGLAAGAASALHGVASLARDALTAPVSQTAQERLQQRGADLWTALTNPLDTAKASAEACSGWGAFKCVGATVTLGGGATTTLIRGTPGSSPVPRHGPSAAAKTPIGFAPGEGVSALTANRLQHGTRRLTEAGVLPGWRGKSSPDLIRRTISPILERPTGTFDHTLRGGAPVKGFLGDIDGQQVALMIYKQGPYQGQLATSVVPTPTQLSKWGF